MNEKKEILVFSTIHRNTERFIPVLEALSKEYKIIIIRSGQISQNTKFESKNGFTFSKPKLSSPYTYLS